MFYLYKCTVELLKLPTTVDVSDGNQSILTMCVVVSAKAVYPNN
jgi:hypothetical protein